MKLKTFLWVVAALSSASNAWAHENGTYRFAQYPEATVEIKETPYRCVFEDISSDKIQIESFDGEVFGVVRNFKFSSEAEQIEHAVDSGTTFESGDYLEFVITTNDNRTFEYYMKVGNITNGARGCKVWYGHDGDLIIFSAMDKPTDKRLGSHSIVRIGD